MIDISDIDIRTEHEKERAEMLAENARLFYAIMQIPGCTPSRAFNAMAKKLGITVMTVRKRLRDAGVYKPGKPGRQGAGEIIYGKY